jgi:hypothetical protein
MAAIIVAPVPKKLKRNERRASRSPSDMIDSGLTSASLDTQLSLGRLTLGVFVGTAAAMASRTSHITWRRVALPGGSTRLTFRWIHPHYSLLRASTLWPLRVYSLGFLPFTLAP